MDAPEHPQIYLITPQTVDPETFPALLGRVLDAAPVACIRLDLASRDETEITRVADAVRDVAHARDIAVVLSDHFLLAQRLGLDGVHLGDAARSVRTACKTLGPDAIVGCFCGSSRHDGMTAGEAGADYVSFGPVGASALGDGDQAEPELFRWWSEMIEVPVVAEGGIDQELATRLAPFTDFFGIGDEIWRQPDPAPALAALNRIIAR